MAVPLLLALIAFPFAEIAVLILVGDAIGLLATLALLVLAMVAGGLLIRVQGLATLLGVRAALSRGEAPAEALFQGACVVAAGLLLIIPGFLTDLAAVALLGLLPLRSRIKGWLWGRAAQARRAGDDQPHRRARAPVTIEGEYVTVSEETAPGRSGRSPWAREDDRGRPLEPPQRP